MLFGSHPIDEQIREISEMEFLVYAHDPDPKVRFFRKQTAWFRDQSGVLLATIHFNSTEDEWGYVLMAKGPDGIFRTVDYVNRLLEEEARMRMFINMSLLSGLDKLEQQIFDDEHMPLIKHSLLLTDINEEVKRYFAKYPDKLYELSPRKFEELVAQLLADMGFEVELTRATRDGGSDIIAHIRNAVASFMMLVECKRYAPENKVDVGVIRKVIGVHTIRQPAKSLIVTTSTFTRDAILEANHFRHNLELRDYLHLK